MNCGSALVEEFCAGCGQRTPTPRDYSMRTLFSAAIGHLTNYDGRLVATVRKLFFRPGQLARDHFEGRRAQHLDPFRIFVLSNVLAWLVAPHTNMFGFSLKAGLKFALFQRRWAWAMAARAALAHVSVEELGRRIDAVSASQNSVAVLCLVPMMAVGIWVVMARRGYRFVQHLVFTAHFYCIHLCCALIYLGFVLRPLYRALKAHPSTASIADLLANNWMQHLMMAPALIVYLFFALQRAYLVGPRQSVWRAVVLGLWASTVARAFFDVGFALVLIWA
ncbi:MAG: hypothetical protein JWN44_2855 [Myxococcales bacterium]|nr:hypothetical protein [Myxococcales bacterium]